MSGTEVPRLFSFIFVFSNLRPFAILQVPGRENLVLMLPSVDEIGPHEMHEGSCRDNKTTHKSRSTSRQWEVPQRTRANEKQRLSSSLTKS